MQPNPSNSLSAVEDSVLAKAAQADDLDAFEELVRRYQQSLICFLKFYCHDSHGVEDVAQEAFLKCFLHIRSFDAERPFQPWLYTIARRSIPKKRNGTEPRPLSEPHLVAGPGEDPANSTQIVEDRRLLWRIVRQHTSDDEFQLIWYRYADGMSISEIARSREESVSACKMRLLRLRRRLQTHLRLFTNDGIPKQPISLIQNRAA